MAMEYRERKLTEVRGLLRDSKSKDEGFRQYVELEEYLLGRDPLAELAYIGLSYLEGSRLLGFELVYPSVKTLNDEIFRGDHSKTDTFMAKVNKFVDDNMKDHMLPIHFSVRGGFLLVESWTNNEERDAKLKTFEQKVNEILVGYLSELSKEDEEHYRAMLDKYCKTPVRFS
ncbi:MAG: hypothetical protein ACI9QC_000937, partial [Oceanicoccus sp.]